MARKQRKTRSDKQAPLNFAGALREDVARLFGISGEAVSQWDCPRNSEGRYNLDEVVQWRMDRLKQESTGSDKAGLEAEKIRLQCAKLELEVEERRKNSITVDEHKREMIRMANIFKEYFTKYGRLNLHEAIGKDIDGLRKYWDNLVKLGMNDFAEKIK